MSALWKSWEKVNYYVHEKLNVPLIVTDDDISGTFTFVRALEDYGNTKGLTAEQIGKGWLNYLIEDETILWWGGVRKFDRAHGVHASQIGRSRTSKWLDGTQWQGGGGTDRLTNLH